MKRIIHVLLLTILIISNLSYNIYADDYSDKFEVWFENDELNSNFGDEEIAAILNEMQPGDTAVITINVENRDKSQAVNFWMDNKTIQAMEESRSKAENAGYTYSLVFSGTDGNYDYFNHDIGGLANTSNDGFNEATEGLESYFKMQKATMAPGKSGTLVLTVDLDGESAGYYYQETAGILRFDFAVEIPPTPSPKEEHVPRVIHIPYTGDTLNVNFYIIVEMLSLFLLALVTVAYYIYTKKQGDAR